VAKHLVESEFEVIPSDGAVEVIFIIAVTSLNLVFCRRTPASDIPAPAVTRPPKFDTWHSAWPQKPQGGAGQGDANGPLSAGFRQASLIHIASLASG
jgi:hypothetical protein